MSMAEYQFAAQERPMFPGSPYTPVHSPRRRLAYVCVGLLVGCCTTFTNALVNVNAANLAGSLDLTLAQVSVLPALYVAMNATANLTLIRARAQFGIPNLTLVLVGIYAFAAMLQLIMPSYATAIATRATCGLMAGGLTTLTIFYFVQALSLKARPLAFVIGIGLLQLGTPFARLVPLDVLAMDRWHGLSLIELGVALVVGAAVFAVPLPPSDRSPAFKRLDFVTIGLMIPGFLLFCIVLGEGRLLWWTDRAWLGWSLAISVLLVATALAIEHNRDNPLVFTNWLMKGAIWRYFAVALLVRLALAEQTYGSVGFLTASGLTNDQLHILFVYVALGVVAGIGVACVTLSENSPRYQVLVASLFIALAAFMDSHTNSITRPEQLYVSQTLIAFGTTLFIGPALVYGFLQMLRQGPTHLISLIVVFSTTQNVGGLAGSALLGSAQVMYARAHAASLAERVISADPQVVARIQQGVGTISGVVTDPVLRGIQGTGQLGRALSAEATTLAFDDVFRLVMWASLATALYLACMVVIQRRPLAPVVGVPA
jgi:hypothetical protein